MRESVSGSCLCGAVGFRVTGPFEHFFLCHCSRCRKGSGSAHAATLFSGAATLEWLRGQEGVTQFRISGTRHARSFCAQCGSALPTVLEGGEGLSVPAGCLDEPVGLRPEAHICCDDRADWDADLEQVARLPGLPG